MAAETARRLACDASVVALIENDDGEPLNVGRKTRTISAPLRRVLNARDKGCRFPGCANTRYIDVHHVEHWANGGETKPSNLVRCAASTTTPFTKAAFASRSSMTAH